MKILRLPINSMTFLWCCILGLVVIDVTWFAIAGFSLDTSKKTPKILSQIFWVAITTAIAAQLFSFIKLKRAAYCLLAFMVGYLALYVFAYLSTTINRPFIDTILIELDRRLWFSWYDFVLWIRESPLLMRISSYAYTKQVPLGAGIVVLLCLIRHHPAAYELLLASFIGGVTTIILGALWPAMGGYVFYDMIPQQYQLYPSPFGARSYEHDLLGLRDGSIQSIPLAMKGLIQFPSFHIIFAVLLACTCRNILWLFIPMLAFYCIMIISCLYDGGHYFADILGGIFIGVFSAKIVSILLDYKIITHENPDAQT